MGNRTAELYKVGDKVVVRGKLLVEGGKIRFANQVVTITRAKVGISQDKYEIMEDDSYYWFDDDFIGLYVEPKAEAEVEIFDDSTVAIERTITKVIYNNPATILFYRDDQGKEKKVVSVCDSEDEYSKEDGLKICMLKIMNREINRKLRKYIK